jgi:hypothetical protein
MGMILISFGIGDNMGGYRRVLSDLQEEQTATLVLFLLFMRVTTLIFGKAMGSVYSSDVL